MIDSRMLHFVTLSRDQQATAIRRLRLAGHPVPTIAAATGLSPWEIRRILDPTFDAANAAYTQRGIS